MLGWATALIVSAVALSLAWLLASIWLVVVAFKRSAAWGLVVLLVPFAAVAFAVRHWQSARKPFLASLGAAAAASLLFLVSAGIGAAAISGRVADRMSGAAARVAPPTPTASLFPAGDSRQPAASDSTGRAGAPSGPVAPGAERAPDVPESAPAPRPELLPLDGASIDGDGYAEISFLDAGRAVGRSVRLFSRDGAVHEGDLVGATAGGLEIENAFRTGTVSVEFRRADVARLLVKVAS